jgi:PIN domain nuclease of toxin-antitoxin system
LWAILDNSQLPPRARRFIGDRKNAIVVSAATVWEIAIKHALSHGKRPMVPISGSDALQYFVGAGYEMLAISPEHAAAVDSLPIRHHDPFDRILVAQAISEPLRLVTADARLAEYSDTVILV